MLKNGWEPPTVRNSWAVKNALLVYGGFADRSDCERIKEREEMGVPLGVRKYSIS